MKLSGATFMVTGGGSGLGEATARAFVAAGANVCIVDMNADNGNKVATDLGSQAIFQKTNVTDEASVNAAVDATVARFGRIDGVINAAGVAAAVRVLKTKPSTFQKIVDINLVGTFNVLRAVSLKAAKNPTSDGERGVIINVASVAAFDGQIGQAAYSASKAGVVGMTLPIARDLAKYGIRICTIAPGIFMTPMMRGLPQKAQDSLATQVPFPARLGEPSEFANLCKHIVENQYLNGEVIRLDGSIRMGAR